MRPNIFNYHHARSLDSDYGANERTTIARVILITLHQVDRDSRQIDTTTEIKYFITHKT